MSRSYNGTTQFSQASASSKAVPLTIAFWFNPSSLPASDAIVFNYNADGTTNNSFLCTLKTTGALTINQKSGGTAGTGANSTANATTNKWQHGCFVFSASNSRTVYLNGGNNATDTSAPGAPAGISFADINFGGSQQAFVGQVAQVCVWNVVLTAGEIAALANGTNPLDVRPQSIVNYWPLDGILSPEPDEIGNQVGGMSPSAGAPPAGASSPPIAYSEPPAPAFPATIALSPSSMPSAQSLVAYSQTITASGGASAAACTFAVTSGSLPAGLSLSSAGVLSGTPTVAAGAGGPAAYSFTITATDGFGNTGSQAY